MDGELVFGTIDSGSASVRRYIKNPDQAGSKCFGDRCFACRVQSCMSGEIFGDSVTYDPFQLQPANSRAVIRMEDVNESNVYVQNIVGVDYTGSQPQYLSPSSVDTAFGLGLPGYRGFEAELNDSFIRQLYASHLLKNPVPTIEPAPSPFTSGSLVLGGSIAPEFEEGSNGRTFEWDTSAYDKDLPKSHFKGNALQVQAIGYDSFSEDIHVLSKGHGELPPIVGFDSSAPLIYVSGAEMEDRYMWVTNTLLIECQTFFTEMEHVYDAVEGYILPCSKAHCLPDFEFKFAPNNYATANEISLTVPGWATVTPIGSKSPDRCRWLFGVPKNRKPVEVVDNRLYMALGQPAFRANKLFFNYFLPGVISFQPLNKPKDMYGVFTLAFDYDRRTVITVDHQSIEVVADTEDYSIYLLRADGDSSPCDVGDGCYECSKTPHRCPDKAEYFVQYFTGYQRDFSHLSDGFVTLGSSKLRTNFNLVQKANLLVSEGGFSSFGLNTQTGSSLIFGNSDLPYENGAQFSIYDQRTPTSKLGVLTLGGFRRPELKHDGDTVTMLDNEPASLVHQEYRAATTRGFVSGTRSSEPFGTTNEDYREFFFWSKYPLIYGHVDVVTELVDILATYFEGRKFSDGLSFPKDDLKSLPSIAFVLPSVTGAAFIYLSPKDYSAPSSTQCDTYKLLLGTHSYKGSSVLGKPFFPNSLYGVRQH
ncbi:hypothetical protein FOL47_009164 [Perkinsus chesapeaki]|uniref:Uncharacterized protein n=1 Tax=Perkinsus chesapeaki TaxID=330153 RepID=A0A7J6MU94_PERCH|nr:hypothetical protein FOL47_009164 [Perkinsus chesapeaki]